MKPPFLRARPPGLPGKTTRRVRAALLLLVFGATPAPAQEAAPPADPRAARIDLELSRLVPFGFSGAVGLAEEGRVLLARGHGLAVDADVAPCTADTVFPLDSLSKQFTGAAVLRLAEDERVSLADPLDLFFEDLPGDKRGITLAQLLGHTSGLATGTTTRVEDGRRESLLREVFAAPLHFGPGTGSEYSNFGYCVLAAVCEVASERPFEEYLREALFAPAGMGSTGLLLDERPGRVVAHRYADGVDRGPALAGEPLDWNHVGCSGVGSTVHDLLRWDAALSDGGSLPARVRERLARPLAGTLGAGWVVESTPRGRVMHHDGGSSRGSACEMRRWLDLGLTLVLLSNRDGERWLHGEGLAARVAELALGAELEPPPETGAARAGWRAGLAGAYELGSGASFSISESGGGLVLRGRGQATVDALLGGERAAAARRANERARELLEASLAGEREAPRVVAERIAAARDEAGPVRGFRILGTTADWVSGFADEMTFVELELERGTGLFRIHWADGRVVATGGDGLPDPVELRLAPGPEPDTLSAYHVPTARASLLCVGRDPGGDVEGLELGEGRRARPAR